MLIKILVSLVFSVSALAATSSNLEEVFVVPQGYDSNDNIEITVHGVLPNGCTKVKSVPIQKNGNTFSVDFMLERRNLTGCDELEIQTPINYTNTFDLGQLTPGTYQVQYKTEQGQVTKEFSVVKATQTTLDDELYAPVSSAFIPELLYSDQLGQVILTGMFYSNCMRLRDSNIKVERFDNVFVIIPKAELLELAYCDQEMYPLQNIVFLPEITAPGHYFIHIRSQSGLSVNKIFHIKERRDRPNGRR